MGAVTYKGYVATVDLDLEAETLVGRVVNARVPLDFSARAAGEVLGAFHALVDGYLAECDAAGVDAAKPYSGKLLVRIDPRLHAAVAADAGRIGRSINVWVEHAIRRKIDDSPDRDSYDLDE